LSLLTYTAPVGEGAEHIYSGYLRRGDRLSRIVNGVRHVERDPIQRWVSAISLDVETEDGDRINGRATAASRLLLSIGNQLCVCTLLDWNLDGTRVAGEDQDVWPISEWRLQRAAGMRPRQS
jgi:hypothetical protein